MLRSTRWLIAYQQNGVYRYGASSAFPNQTWNTSNYWVDVRLPAGPGAHAHLHRGRPGQLDRRRRERRSSSRQREPIPTGALKTSRSQVNWASSNTAVATINTSGLASATSAGNTTISATMSSVTGSATLTVPAAALGDHDKLPAQRHGE